MLSSSWLSTSTELRNAESRGSSPQRPKRGMRSKSFAVSWFLSHWIGKQNGSLVVFEATGAYYRCPEAALAANGTPFTKVNPRWRNPGIARRTRRYLEGDCRHRRRYENFGAIVGGVSAPDDDPGCGSVNRTGLRSRDR